MSKIDHQIPAGKTLEMLRAEMDRADGRCRALRQALYHIDNAVKAMGATDHGLLNVEARARQEAKESRAAHDAAADLWARGLNALDATIRPWLTALTRGYLPAPPALVAFVPFIGRPVCMWPLNDDEAAFLVAVMPHLGTESEEAQVNSALHLLHITRVA